MEDNPITQPPASQPHEVTPPAEPKKPLSRWKYGVAGCVVITLCSGIVVFVLVSTLAKALWNAPANMIDNAQQALQPKETIQTTVHTAITEIRRQPKLIVMTVPINVAIKKASAKEVLGVSMGTTEVLLFTQDNMVQFTVDLQFLNDADFVYDANTKKLVVTIPPPQLDEEMVVVQTNPNKMIMMTQVGLLRTDAYSGQEMRDLAKRELRTAVIEAGRSPALYDQARLNAALVLQNLLAPAASKLQPGAKVEVNFKAR